MDGITRNEPKIKRRLIFIGSTGHTATRRKFRALTKVTWTGPRAVENYTLLIQLVALPSAPGNLIHICRNRPSRSPLDVMNENGMQSTAA